MSGAGAGTGAGAVAGAGGRVSAAASAAVMALCIAACAETDTDWYAAVVPVAGSRDGVGRGDALFADANTPSLSMLLVLRPPVNMPVAPALLAAALALAADEEAGEGVRKLESSELRSAARSS